MTEAELQVVVLTRIELAGLYFWRSSQACKRGTFWSLVKWVDDTKKTA